MKKELLLTFLLLTSSYSVMAQDGRSSGSQYLTPVATSDVFVPFDVKDEGVKLPIRWGMDVAWVSEQNMRKGINFIGKDDLSIVRGSFRTNEPLTNGTSLTSKQIDTLKERMRITNIMSNNCDLILNSDQEAGVHEWYSTSNNANVDHWVAMISANIDYITKNYPKHKVLGVSPFNEPDYKEWNQGSKTNMKDISKKLKEKYPDLIITAGNTLNCDEALGWYNAVKPYVDWGNTHQLAGSFDNYANFFKKVTDDGNHGYADELHNICEAMVGAEYGMKTGIWWGFDSRARGEFCQMSNHGSRIGYAENRDKWTAASVYRNDETKAVKAFVASSERQAYTSSFNFVSPDKEVYFDGHGPTRNYLMEVPGGTGYQVGQTNAECVIDVCYGEDVPPSAITPGVYKIMNYATLGVVAVNGVLNGQANISQMRWTGEDVQKWNIEPVDSRIGGDYSFYKIASVSNGDYMNVLNNATTPGNVICYNAKFASNEQWYLEYAGDGCYFIRNRESGLYLELIQRTPAVGTNIRQANKSKTTSGLALQMWRILPLDVECEVVAPAIPSGLKAKALPAAVELTWNANEETDLAGYMVLRTVKGANDWNTIARKVNQNTYVDNTCRQEEEYEYKIKAIDKSENQSACTDVVTAQPTASKGLIAHWTFEEDDLSVAFDRTENQFDAIYGAKASLASSNRHGKQCLTLGGSKVTDYMRLPYQVADMPEMTISLWALWKNSGSKWARLFDFGNGTDQYMYLTPNSGSGMRFAIKNGGDEEVVSYRTMMADNKWVHVAVTIGNERVALYVNGKLVGENNMVTIVPSDFHPTLNYIGRSQFVRDPRFQGSIDDIRIYNYALTEDEINTVMQDLTDGIKATETTTENAKTSAYQLNGMKAGRNQHGIIIENNKKLLRK